MSPRSLATFSLLAVVAAACSSTPSTNDGGTDAAPTDSAVDGGGATCASYAAAYCNFLNACTPGTLQATYGTVAGCNAVRAADCTTNLGAPSSGITQSFLTACSASATTMASSCSAGPVVQPIETPTDPCAIVGAGGAGAACGTAAQCATNVCEHVGTQCGRCTATGKLGEGCDLATGVTCPRGMTCADATSTCVTTVPVGQSCDLGVTTACVGGSSCVVAKAGDTSGTCQTSGATVGAACDPRGVGMPMCFAAAGLYCNAMNQCAAINYAAPAATCTSPPTTSSDIECAAGDCTAGTCAGFIAAGQACTLDGPVACAIGTACVVGSGSEMGTCTTVTPSCTTAPALAANFTYQPSNVALTDINQQASMAADEVISAACTVETDASSPSTTCFTSPITAVKQAGGTTVNIVVVRSLAVQPSTVVTVTGSVPLVIVSLSDVIWFGQLAANSSTSSLTQGAGGAPASGTNALGGGAGGGKAASSTGIVGGGGGSFCGVGGAGGGTAATSAAYGTADNRPLAGGSAGGGGAAGGGAGGGSVQLVAAGTIVLKAGSSITVGGQAGTYGGVAPDQNAGGGGSGGSILLEGLVVTMNGTLAANGGGGGGDYSKTASDATADANPAPGGAAGPSEAAGGAGAAGATTGGTAGKTSTGLNAGGGGGGVGRIRINTSNGTAGGTGVYSPDSTTTCTSQGTVRALGTGA